jgi:hypothetical protein
LGSKGKRLDFSTEVIRIKHPEPRIDGQGLYGRTSRILYSNDSIDVVVAKCCGGGNSKVLERWIFELELRCDVSEGIRASASAQCRADDKFSFTLATDVGTFVESEHVFGIHLIRPSVDVVGAHRRYGDPNDSGDSGGCFERRIETRTELLSAMRKGAVAPKRLKHSVVGRIQNERSASQPGAMRFRRPTGVSADVPMCPDRCR